RGVCWANVGACYLKMGENKEAVEACTESLLDSPTYVKALHRRATANVAINTWSSLTSAQDDLKLLLPLLPSSPPSAFYKQSRSLLASLPPKIKEKQDKEKDEMMDKLKGLGNSVLGRLGLSTENFKFEPNGAGGYSMNFVR
ncbi:hypothetical protein BDY24DRAFT_335514, partial [Mrakia frigida]|uniref:uncharacterized protein n=1 Tax=Mrakia frigida TaxID=29902 RepID=UPI003FCC1F43